jgi:hypothetical protein
VSNDLKAAVNQLVKPPRVKKPLPAAQPVPAIGAGVGFAQPQAPSSGGNGTAVASPWVETKRTTSDEVVEIISTDGYTVIQVPQQVDVTMQDANRKLIVQRFING